MNHHQNQVLQNAQLKGDKNYLEPDLNCLVMLSNTSQANGTFNCAGLKIYF